MGFRENQRQATGETYQQSIIKKRVQNQFNRRINMMAGGGLPRAAILMRWIKKPRLIKLMETLQQHLQSGNPNWLGSFNEIEKLVRSTGKQMGITVTKPKLGKMGEISRAVTIKKSCSDIDFIDSYMDMIENPSEETLEKALEGLGGFCAQTISEMENVNAGLSDWHNNLYGLNLGDNKISKIGREELLENNSILEKNYDFTFLTK